MTPIELHPDVERELVETPVDEEGARVIPDWVTDEDEAKVDRYIEALKYYRGELAAIEARADAYEDEAIERVKQYRETQGRNSRESITFLETRLLSFSEAVGRVKRVSPAGTLKWRKGSNHIEILNLEKFLEIHGGTVFVDTTTTHVPSKKAIAAHIKANAGEIPDHADQVRAPDTFLIEFPKDKQPGGVKS